MLLRSDHIFNIISGKLRDSEDEDHSDDDVSGESRNHSRSCFSLFQQLFKSLRYANFNYPKNLLSNGKILWILKDLHIHQIQLKTLFKECNMS